MADNPVVRFSHVSMRFPGVLANDDVSLDIRRGEVFALVGENGAGKSTLMNLLYGLYRPTLGEIEIMGKKISPQHSPQSAMAMGVGMVHQHFTLTPSFTVAQNIVLGHEPRKWGLLYDQQKAVAFTNKLVETYGLHVDANAPVRELSIGLQQRVEILKALGHGADVLVLDEPTAVLTPQETDELFAVIRRIVAEKGMTVLLITHKLQEVMAVSDRVGVMRRGKLTALVNTRDTSERELAAAMVGRNVIFDDIRTHREPGKPSLVVKDLSALSDRGLPALHEVSLTVHAGEILGVVGVEGNGQTELVECITGLREETAGQVLVMDRDASRMTAGAIRQLGLAHIPEDRMQTGMSAQATLWENLLLGKQRRKEFAALHTHLKRGAIHRYAEELTQKFDIRASSVDSPAGELSGGNIQKAVIAREFSLGAPVLIVSQPTRGVDIGAIEFIHEAILQKRNEGCAVLLVSADLDELFRLSDRMITLFEGRVTGAFKAGEVTKEEIGFYMTGARAAVPEGEATV